METNTATPATTAEVAKEVKPRQPKLSLTVDGVTHNLLKYPFPVKAANFPVTINGEPAVASCTAGRGKAYTYILYKNTSFYIPGTLTVDAACSVTFPEGYKFDDAKQVRVSNYKPKKKADKEAPKSDQAGIDAVLHQEGGTPASSGSDTVAVVTAVEEKHGSKAARRGR